MTNTIEPLGSVGTVRAAVNVPAAEEQRDGAVDTNDNFTLSNALDDFNVCARSNNATGLGCAVLVAGSVTSFLWARGKAGVLTMLGDIAGAAKVLEAEARAAVKENRVREAISLFREAKGLYRRANDQQKAAETGREYAEANELLGKGLAVQAGSGERAARFLQESARAYSEIGLHERAVVVFLELAPLYGGMNKPEMSAGSLESAGRNYARAGRFTAAAEMFAEAGELREKNHLPDEPDNLTMVSGYRSLQQKIEYARGQGDIRKAARLETELAERIISHYLTEFAPHGCDVFARDFAYHSRVASELHLQAGEYTLAMERLARLTTVLWKEGMDGHAGVEYLNTVLRALEVTKGLLSRGQPDRRQKEKDLAKYVRAFEDAYEKVPFRTKREGRYGKIVGDYLRAGQLYVIAGKREKAKEMFQRAAAQFADERFEQDARAIAVEAEDALGLDGPERVRKKWNDIAPPMTSAERKARIGQLAGALKDIEEAGGLDRMTRIYELMIENAKGALKYIQNPDRAWFVARLYDAKIGLYIARLAEGRVKGAGAILKKIKAMKARVVTLPEHEQGRRAREFALRTRLESAYQAFKEGDTEKSFKSFVEILQIAQREGAKAFETATLEAMGDVTLLNGNRDAADRLYDRAMAIVETDETREGVVLRRNEALTGNDTGVVKEIWGEMHPALWLFSRSLSELDGGVADQGLKDAVPHPEIARAEGAVGREKGLATRREFLDAYRALKRSREAAREAGKK